MESKLDHTAEARSERSSDGPDVVYHLTLYLVRLSRPRSFGCASDLVRGTFDEDADVVGFQLDSPFIASPRKKAVKCSDDTT